VKEELITNRTAVITFQLDWDVSRKYIKVSLDCSRHGDSTLAQILDHCGTRSDLHHNSVTVHQTVWHQDTLEPVIVTTGPAAETVVFEADQADGGQPEGEQDPSEKTPAVKASSPGIRDGLRGGSDRA